MNLNISLKETSVQKIYKGIQFTFENFQEEYIDSSYVENVTLCPNSRGDDYDSVTIIFNKSFIDDKAGLLERLCDRKDVVYVDVIYIDKIPNIEVLVPYKEDENGFNLLQSVSYPDGQVCLEISK